MEASPFAGKVGLTSTAQRSITAFIRSADARLAMRETMTVAEVDALKGKLDSYSEVISASKASMGTPTIAPEKSIEVAQAVQYTIQSQ